ncbi:hypothetical protein K504DRAFT_459807 [Pleomassaria siparia CBS 279.74]|uniref:Uncharacterized protein n=1 Tax=Pleomassaria siparia CBS 279.74 TaxID=1314801 RepID=A0A6G1JPE7_9PLEO|nr:hypothetical protein K504DRAFT_459807 [Pleomassaria siparia CBS 279.74]
MAHREDGSSDEMGWDGMGRFFTLLGIISATISFLISNDMDLKPLKKKHEQGPRL